MSLKRFEIYDPKPFRIFSTICKESERQHTFLNSHTRQQPPRIHLKSLRRGILRILFIYYNDTTNSQICQWFFHIFALYIFNNFQHIFLVICIVRQNRTYSKQQYNLHIRFVNNRSFKEYCLMRPSWQVSAL